MVFRYPNGAPYNNNEASKTKKQEKKVPVDFGKRGMNFEEEINQSNVYYLNHKVAVIHKKPTPVQIVKVDYPRRSAAVIKEAYFRQASTTDYNGVYNGRYLDFEAKETRNKTSFPFKNFHNHQIEHMKQCIEQQGICFVLLWFSSLNRCFFLSAEKLLVFWTEQQNGKKSLPLKLLESEGIEIKLGLAPRVPYLNAVDKYLQKKN
ncbi:Holliday junction resolvase RecU [Enterococcus sp. BWB1-3]|uniref:Holliday junction resolvase RecU n=1 Tax=unclassified Enterococcus TaxID=2608891 RepID=UPI00192077C4|nr:MULTISPECIES: Holliday junction resolvase RecU [unclassified Enterococcus]MBL1228424.1 Holliday junction resolvase RecU [Enterococcus sp. BWB1-3]MCB5954317.1 Holliday junction resolvase RecU [Enterococcus sp. CWB-B31]